MAKYDVKVRYAFEGTRNIVAEDRDEAERKERDRKDKVSHTAMCFSGRIEELRKDIIEAIRQLLYSHGMTEITFTGNDDDPVWVIWFDKNADPYECQVTGLEITDDSLSVLAAIKDSMEEVACHTPFELGASNIDWLNELLTRRGFPK